MTTKMPGDPKIPLAIKTAKFMGPSKFAHYSTVPLTSAKPAVFSPVLPVVSAQLRATTPPTSYINPERLMDDVGELYAAHQRVFKSLDALDAAARYAGTPIRSGSPRERFTHLLGVIREVETTARKAWQDELIAAGGTDRSLQLALKKGAKNDTLYVTKLLTKHGETSDGHKATDPDGMPVTPSLEHDDPFDEAMPNALALTTGVPAKQVRSSKQFGYKLPPFGYELGLAAEVRDLLKDGGFGTDRLTHGELLKLVALFKGASAQSATATIMSLTDRELRLIADDMDSSGLENYAGLSSSQKESFIAKLATQLDATQFVRIAKAFDDDVQIAQVLARTAGTQHLAAPFVAYCEAKFSVKGNEETKRSAALATAITIANLSAHGLAHFMAEQSNNGVFLSQVFAEASGHTKTEVRSYDFLGARTTRIIHRFDPSLLAQINQTAGLIPQSNEASRFETFKRTISALEWMNFISNDSSDDPAVKAVLLKSTDLLRTDLAAQLEIHSADQPTYVSWITMLIRSGEAHTVTALVAEARRSAVGGDYRWAGYLLGIVVRAANDIDQKREDEISFVSDLVSALLNAAPLAGQIGGELLRSVGLQIQADGKLELKLSERIGRGLNTALAGPEHEFDRNRLNQGLLDAISTSILTG
jgi:hypothetical protein